MGEKRNEGHTARPPDRPGEMERWRRANVNLLETFPAEWGWQPPVLPDTVGGETILLQARDGVADNG